MTKERELLKEAAEIMKSVKQVAGDVRFVNEIKNDLTVSIENIEAYLSQPDAVAMTLQQAKNKVAQKRYGGKDWDEFKNDNPTTVLMELLMNEAAHLFMESNRVQRWIPVEERLPDVGQKVLFATKKQVHAGEYLDVFSNHEFVDSAICYADVVAWQPLREVPRVYLEGNK